MKLACILVILLKLARTKESNEKLKEEIEAVKEESKDLANQLAEMLSVLQVADLRNAAVESAVVGDDETVQKVLSEMVDKINKIENDPESNDIVKKEQVLEDKNVAENIIPTFSDKEQRLKSSLDNLEIVANEIKTLSVNARSPEEINAVNQMAKVLEAMTAKLSLDEVKISFDVVLGREDRIANVENDIEGMIDSLVDVVSNLTSSKERYTLERGPKQLEDFDADVDEDVEVFDPSEKEVDNENTSRDPIIIRRKGDLDDGLNGDTTSTQEEGEEECTTRQRTNTVKKCVPTFEKVDKPIKIFGQVPKSIRHCYEVTRTICDDVSNIVKREVCVYPYWQKPVMAVAHLTEIGFETRRKGMKVSKCKHIIESTVEGDREVEKCEEEYVEKEFWMPVINEGFEDLIELDLPDPQEHCQVMGFNVPEVVCRDITKTECSDVHYLEDFFLPENHIQAIIPSHRPKCELEVLNQSVQDCTVKKKKEGDSNEKLEKQSSIKYLDEFTSGELSPEGDDNDEENQIVFETNIKVDDLFSI